MLPPDDMPASGFLGDYLVFWLVWVALAGGTFLFFRFSRPMPRRRRLVAGNALVTLAMLWTVVLAAESYLRFVYDASDSYGLTVTNWAWFHRHVHLNRHGYRDAEFTSAKPEQVRRIAFVGDSFTLGYGVPEMSDLFPQRVGAALEAAQPGRWETWNLGYVGDDTGQEAEIVEGIVPAQSVDHVVLGYCLNDVDDLLPAERRFDRLGVPRPGWIKPWQSYLVDFLWFRLRLRDDPRVRGYFDWVVEVYEDPELWAVQVARFARIAQHCEQARVPLTVVVFPLFGRWGPGYPFHALHDKTVAAWRALDVEVLDLRAAYEEIPGDELVANRFDAHPNARAHGIAAAVILRGVFGVE